MPYVKTPDGSRSRYDSPDGTMHVEIRRQHSATGHSVRTASRTPKTDQPFAVGIVRAAEYQSLMRMDHPLVHEMMVLETTADPEYGAIPHFFHRMSTRDKALLEDLGYRATMRRGEAKGEVRTRCEFSWPSIEQLNEIADALPDNGLRFKAYEGGCYSAGEAMEAFMRGEYLLATHEPYASNDQASLQAVGVLFAPGSVIAEMQRQLAPMMERMRAEAALPSLPESVSEHHRAFFSPSYAVIAGVQRSFEEMVQELGDAVLKKQDPQRLGEPVIDALRHALAIQMPLHDRVPSVFESIPYEQLQEAVIDVWQRYHALGEVAREMSSPVLERAM